MADPTPAAALTIVADVRKDSPIPESGMGHATALTHPDARVVILTFAAGHLLKEHATPFPILMQALDGELIVRADGQETTLRPGGLMRMDPGLRHEVESVVDSRLMLTLITRQ